MSQPVIGLTLDNEPPGGYSNFPWYAIRENYCNAVRRAGGLPILLPHDPDAAAAYLDIGALGPRALDFEGPDDLSALDKANLFRQSQAAEIWESTRLVARITCAGEAGQALW